MPRSHYFYTDGGAILVYGRSYPTIENVEMHDNSSSVCGAGLSVQHQLETLKDEVRLRNCIFRNNRTAVSGSAADLLSPGSSAVFDNCLFVGNISNEKLAGPTEAGYGALTVFPYCRVVVRRCTFTGNWAGVDDRGQGSFYEKTIFWNNNRSGGRNSTPRFELNIANAQGVAGCFIHGDRNDLRGRINPRLNTFDPPDPDFDADFRPRNPLYRDVGYRPGLP